MRQIAERASRNYVDEKNDAGLWRLVAGGGFYGFFEVAADAGFGDVGADAGLCGVAGQVERFEVGDDQDFGFGGVAANDFGGGEAVHRGHGDVEEDDVGLQLGGFFYGVIAVFGFAADGPIGVILEEKFQAGADGGAVVCDEDSNFRHVVVRSVRTAGTVTMSTVQRAWGNAHRVFCVVLRAGAKAKSARGFAALELDRGRRESLLASRSADGFRMTERRFRIAATRITAARVSPWWRKWRAVWVVLLWRG
jgi:hypothetical protein